MEALCLAKSANDKGGCFKACLLTWIIVLVVFVFATAGFVLGPMCIANKAADNKCKMELIELTMTVGWAGFITAISIAFWLGVISCCAWRWIKVCARWKEANNPLKMARINKETAELQLEAEKLRHERETAPPRGRSPQRSASPSVRRSRSRQEKLPTPPLYERPPSPDGTHSRLASKDPPPYKIKIENEYEPEPYKELRNSDKVDGRRHDHPDPRHDRGPYDYNRPHDSRPPRDPVHPHRPRGPRARSSQPSHIVHPSQQSRAHSRPGVYHRRY